MDIDNATLESFLDLNFPCELFESASGNASNPDSDLGSSSDCGTSAGYNSSSDCPSPTGTFVTSPLLIKTDRNSKHQTSRHVEDIGLEYNLRPRSVQKRVEAEERRQKYLQSGRKREPKPKNKAPPLSKYRRKTANARERTRMQEINTAFERLQNAVPSFPFGTTDSKLTKITTLRLAVNYIRALSRILQEADEKEATAGLNTEAQAVSKSQTISPFPTRHSQPVAAPSSQTVLFDPSMVGSQAESLEGLESSLDFNMGLIAPDIDIILEAADTDALTITEECL